MRGGIVMTSIDSKMEGLVDLLNKSNQAYYSGDTESPLTDAQYDSYLADLLVLEKKAGYRLADSPTAKVGYEESNDKVKHYQPILSLKSTKDIADLLKFLGEREALLSWKLDGVSAVLYYQNGKLDRAVSRGDGTYGRDITHHALMISNVPEVVSNNTPLIIRGEICVSHSDFYDLNQIDDGEKYRNPRNLAAGLINSTRNRSEILSLYVTFIAHSVILIEEQEQLFETKSEQLDYISGIGFNVVPHVKVANYTLKNAIDKMTDEAGTFDFPVDGLVLTLDDVIFSKSLGSTAKYPKDSMAFKWPDESKLTKVTGMGWSVSQTGLITPIVEFAPVDIDGTTIQRANLHTLKGFEELEIGIGDVLEIFKANKIIPEVKDNLSRSGTERYPKKCPVCSTETRVFENGITKKLYCDHCADNERG